MARERLGVDQFNTVARAAFGRGRCLAAVDRMRGGSTKGVYRLTFDDDTTAVAYVWAPTENYWHGLAGHPDGAAGIVQFEVSYRVPELDEARLRFYALAHHLSLVEGPLRLLDGDFPDRARMLAIATANTERALTFVGEAEDP
jgi:hypothetical protein